MTTDAETRAAMVRHYQDLPEKTRAVKVTAQAFGLSASTVTKHLHAAGVKPDGRSHKGGNRKPMSERNRAVVQPRRSGATLEDTGAAFGMSKERVRQIVARYGDAEAKAVFCTRPRPALVARACPCCGASFTKPAKQRFCSRPCAGRFNNPRTEGRAEAILAFRRRGISWKAAAAAVGMGTAAAAFIAVRRHRNRTGEDVSDAYGFVGRPLDGDLA